jgi:hypothetical protein
MNYKELQRQKAVRMRDALFCDRGGGIYKGVQREFVLLNPELNLWPGFREDVLAYYSDNRIVWWDSGNKPSGHLLSSQIACLNHLYFLRQRLDLSTLVLRQIDSTIQKAIFIDSGFVEFEKVGAEKLGGEESSTRGANCTSIDALMLGETIYGKRILFLIEWKYTEAYSRDSKADGDSGEQRWANYIDLLEHERCPIKPRNFKDLYYEPFYQMMRQTLLGWQMTVRKEYGAEDWVHVHVIPNENRELRETITSPKLLGNSITEAWRSVLKQPEKYVTIDPKQFLSPVAKCPDTKAIMSYLGKRYWD